MQIKFRKKPLSKYFAKGFKHNGLYFASKKEFAYWKVLKTKKKAGEIQDFDFQKSYVLQEEYTNGLGKNIRAIKIIIDFTVYDRAWNITLVDTKGFKTDAWNLKKKLFEKIYFPLFIEEK